MIKPTSHTETICLMEIDAIVLSMMQNILEDLGYRVLTGSDDSIAIDFTLIRPDLIFVDHRLIKGQSQFCHRLINELDNLQVPIILTTTENQPRKLLERLKVNDVLSKPFGLDEFVAKVFYWLTRDR